MALAQCRECAREVSTEASSCPHCGVPGPTGAAAGRSAPSSAPATGSPFTRRPPIVSARQERAAQAEPATEHSLSGRLKTPTATTHAALPAQIDFSHLPEYYRKEFQKIYESNETYTDKWNWAAFLFGLIWGITKGLWLAGLDRSGGRILDGGRRWPSVLFHLWRAR